MVNKEYVNRIVTELKQSVNLALNKKQYDDTLSLISACASLLYKTNLYYTDNDLEEALKTISSKTILKSEQYESNDFCVFWDGFGLNDRGLAQIYLRALCQYKKVIYVTYSDRESQIPDLRCIVNSSDNICEFVDRSKASNLKQIFQLKKILDKYRPSAFFFYSVPDDVVATTIMYAYEGLLSRIQINLTDHAFWLGSGCIDKCIEFREYGASISEHYRSIGKEKIRIIPFYPMVHKERKFQGYPFAVKPNQKVVFSGGDLYKTLGADNMYYKIVDRLLDENPDVIFWYAGSGNDSEIKKLQAKYPSRAFLTTERSDLFQVLMNCCFYLSTYPICGGLMYQYAAMAGKVPITLKRDECNDGFLINQTKINIEFTDLQAMFDEINRLLNDSDYLEHRSKEMKEAVVSQEVFEKKVIEIFMDDTYAGQYPYINTDVFRQTYLENLTEMNIERFIFRKNTIKICIKYYPRHILKGIMSILCK